MKGKVCSASKDKKESLLKESDATLEPEEPRGPCLSVSQSVRKKWAGVGESTSADKGSLWEQLRPPTKEGGLEGEGWIWNL